MPNRPTTEWEHCYVFLEKTLIDGTRASGELMRWRVEPICSGPNADLKSGAADAVAGAQRCGFCVAIESVEGIGSDAG